MVGLYRNVVLKHSLSSRPEGEDRGFSDARPTFSVLTRNSLSIEHQKADIDEHGLLVAADNRDLWYFSRNQR
jgi:hypothetical protein